MPYALTFASTTGVLLSVIAFAAIAGAIYAALLLCLRQIDARFDRRSAGVRSERLR